MGVAYLQQPNFIPSILLKQYINISIASLQRSLEREEGKSKSFAHHFH